MKAADFDGTCRFMPVFRGAALPFVCASMLGLACAFSARGAEIFKLDNEPPLPAAVPATPQPETGTVAPAGIPPPPPQSPAPAPAVKLAPPTVTAPASKPSAAAAPMPLERPSGEPEPPRQPEAASAPRPANAPAKGGGLPMMFLCLAASASSALAVFTLFFYGLGPARAWIDRQEERYDRVLRQELLLAVTPRSALLAALGGTALAVMIAGAYWGVIGAVIAGAVSLFFPGWVLKYLIAKRLKQLNTQLPDGLTSLSSGVRAGLNLVQAMQLLARNTRGPIQQEFSQILREYEMGLDLNQAMRNAANRIGSPLYRLTFTAIEMHRIRGGDSGESMDRIAESVREIQRLEGKLDAVTSESRAQAAMLSFMPVVIIGILLLIAPEQTSLLFTTNTGKITLVLAGAAILFARRWIHDIMQVDI